jgi:hypothetical protein
MNAFLKMTLWSTGLYVAADVLTRFVKGKSITAMLTDKTLAMLSPFDAPLHLCSASVDKSSGGTWNLSVAQYPDHIKVTVLSLDSDGAVRGYATLEGPDVKSELKMTSSTLTDEESMNLLTDGEALAQAIASC